MPVSTYAELQSTMADFLNRSDMTATIPALITLAEAAINRDVNHWRAEKRSQTAIAERYISLPDDFRSPIRLYVDGNNRPLRLILATEMQDKRYGSADAAGVPCFYAITAGEIELYPTPSSGALNMYYCATIPALSDANTSNWLLTTAPDVYLYGALLQSAPFLEHDERLATWGTLYTAAVSALNADSKDAVFGGQRLVAR